jgi:hypothetical protein
MPVESLKCPNCGAPLEAVFQVMRCPYCNTTVTFQPGKPNAAAGVPASAPPIADPVVTQLVERMVALCRAGKKIEAIKLYRARTGDGLAEAKNAVEDLERGHSSPLVMEKLRLGAGG